MALCVCSNRKESPRGRKSSFNFTEGPHSAIIVVSDNEMPACFNFTPQETNLKDDWKECLPFPSSWSDSKENESSTSYMSLISSKESKLKKYYAQYNSDPLEQAHIAYSSKSSVIEQTIFVDDELLEALAAKSQKQLSIPPTQRLKLSRKSMSYIKSKDRLSQNVVIRRIVYPDSGAFNEWPEMYMLMIALNEVWKKLDLDQDTYLNMSELTRFCEKIWKEPVKDGCAQKIMEVYAEEHPQKGMNFHEWCILIKQEDPDLQGFVEEIYEIFVFQAESQLAADSEIVD